MDSCRATQPPTKAEILNEQFHSVYTQEDTGTIPNKGPSPHPSMHDITVNLNGVKKLLKNLKPYKASGPDGIPTYILRAAAEELAPMLTRLFQSSLDTGLVPTEWRRANIVPLFIETPTIKLQACITHFSGV